MSESGRAPVGNPSAGSPAAGSPAAGFRAAGSPPEFVPVAPARRKRSWLRIVVLVFGSIALLGVIVAVAVPYLASRDAVRADIERMTSRALRTEVVIASHDFSWFRGIEVSDVVVENPPGFPSDRPAFKLGRLHGDMSLLSLLWGEFKLTGSLEGMEVRLYEKADGSTNLGTMLGAESPPDPDRPPVPGTEPGPGSEPAGLPTELDWAKVFLDLTVRDSLIEIVHQERGVVESLRNVDAGLRKPLGSTAVRLHFNADLHREASPAGRVELVADLDADRTRPAKVSFKSLGLELASYRSLLNSFVDHSQYPKAFAGRLDGEVTAELRHGEAVTLGGELVLTDPHFEGALFGGMNLTGKRWTFRPQLRAGLGEALDLRSVSTEGFDLDTGFLRVTGMLPAAARELAKSRPAAGLEFDLDLTRLAAMGLAALGGMQSATGRVKGAVTLATDWREVLGRDPLEDSDLGTLAQTLAQRWTEFVRTKAELSIDGMRRAGLELRNLHLLALVEDGVATLQSQPGGLLNDGPLTIKAETSLVDLAAAKVDATMQWRDGAVGGDVVPWLRYVVPVLDGLPLDKLGALDFKSTLDLELGMAGPLSAKQGESVLQWLDHWRGKGGVGLIGGGFTPAPAWQTALDFAGIKSPLAIEKIDSKFSFADGAVTTEVMDFTRKASKWSLSGSATLDGKIDYRFDLRGLLRGHKDGDAVLRYLGDKPLEARMGGTLDAPKLHAPSFQTLVKEALRSAAKGALEKILDPEKAKEEGGLKRLKDLLKRK